MNRLESETMNLPTAGSLPPPSNDLPVIAIDMPVMYEDEGQEELGESTLHTESCFKLHYAFAAYFANTPAFRVFADLDTYYHPVNSRAYFSADVMVARPFTTLPKWMTSYRIGEHGPAPLLIVEVLSERSHQQYDLTLKSTIYADLGVPEFMLVDASGEYFPRKLEIRRLRLDSTWDHCQDADGGVTSDLGFRVAIDSHDAVRVTDVASGAEYGQHLDLETMQRRIALLENELSVLRGVSASET